MFDVTKLSKIRIGLASPEKIRSWSHGEVTKPETINYRSQKPEMDGLYCERIFGPSKDYECHCGKYKKIRYAGTVCERCGVEVTTRDVRRERMGHIELAAPCTHIWYLKGVPSKIATLLDIAPKQLEAVAYYAAHLVLNQGKSSVLKYAQYIDERDGREIFINALRELVDNAEAFELLMGSDDYNDALALIESLENRSNEFFPYEDVCYLLKKYMGAEFGEGAAAIKRLLQEVNLRELERRLKEAISAEKITTQNKEKYTKRLEVVEAFIRSNNKPEWMVLDVLPVIPPDLRPLLALDGGRFATSDLNDLYRTVIYRNDVLKKMIGIGAPPVILMNEKRLLQEAVDALIDNRRRNRPIAGSSNRPLKSLTCALKGKQGRFRQNLLGKRVDYSGRSVIAVGPSLRMYQCGLPREMAIQLLHPFIVHELLENKVVNANRQADKIIERRDPEVYNIVDRIIKKHPVLLNRAPTLHRLGIQAFQPVLVDGHAIRLHPLVCAGFNADFDGDQMAVHIPLGKSAQEEALRLMLASNNILGPKDGKPICAPTQDMVLGNYYLTLEKSADDFRKEAKHLREIGDNEEADLYDYYAECEGKVFASIDDVVLAYQEKQISLHNRIALPGKALLKNTFSEEMNNSYLITSVGKVIFNLVFPSDFPYLNRVTLENLTADDPSYFVKKGTNIKEVLARQPLYPPFKKSNLEAIVNQVFQRYDRMGNPKTSAILDKIKDQGFEYSTLAGFTISYFDIPDVKGREEIIAQGDEKVEEITNLYQDGIVSEDERYRSVCNIWDGVKKDVEGVLEDQFSLDKTNAIYMMVDSGARGNKKNMSQLAGIRGCMSNTAGKTIEIPVKSSFRDGMSVAECFIASHGGRKGAADTALKTADSGYLTRKLVDVSHSVIVQEEDCGTDRGFVVSDIVTVNPRNGSVKVIVKLEDRLVGRFALNDIVNPKTGEVIVEGNTEIDEDKAKAIVAAGIKEVEIRSLFGCQTSGGVCVHCYGRSMATGRLINIGDAVGVMAAQSIGEPGTQLTLRTINSGGVAGDDITQGLPRVKELFEAQEPKNKAMLAQISGEVTDIREEGGCSIVTIRNENDVIEHKSAFGANVKVKKGDHVEGGDPLTGGAIAPKELLVYANVAAVQKYILEEVQKVYKSEDVQISDKHIEVIISQMLRIVYIDDAGDSDLIAGTRATLRTVEEKNEELLINGQKPISYHPLILSIVKASRETDSFLSAASFQETTRVLTDAAVQGKEDYLRGLKENVITGRLIPAGRGLLSEVEEEKGLEGFAVEDEIDMVADRYIEEHDRSLQVIHDKIKKIEEENNKSL